jgi:Leucine-rich repeat (LRR) protein
MKNHLFLILAYLIVLTFLFQPIQTLANSDQVEISHNSSMGATQTPVPGEPYGEQFEKEFEMEIEAERQRILEEHLREVGMPENLLSHEYGSNPQEKPEYIPPGEEVIAQTKAQVDSFSCASVTDVSNIECQALVALYESTNGAGWVHNDNWLVTNTVGTWYGIYISSGHVNQILLLGNNLNGNIPAALGNLSYLETLSLIDNQLSGSIPAALGNLSNLWELLLDENQLSGSIPPALGNLSNLRELILGSNQLRGSIPSVLGNLSNLGGLGLSNNQLSGSIPPAIGNLSNLYYLYLDNNQLSGSIPTGLGNLNNLSFLSLYNNQLSGSIPSELGNLSNLDILLLDNNQLSGSIPPAFGNLSKVYYLYLDNNQLSGSIPPAFGNLSYLKYLHLDNNQLSGSIPSELGYLSNLELLSLSNNQLNGGIPLSFVNLTTLRYFYFSDTFLCEPTEEIFTSWKNTVFLWIGTGSVCGPYKQKYLVVPLNWQGTQIEFVSAARLQLSKFINQVPLNSCPEKILIRYLDVKTHNFNNFACSGSELSDIRDFVKNEVKLNPSEWDVIIGFTETSPCPPTAGRSNNIDTIWSSTSSDIIVAHELGHIYGLSDQYCSNQAGSNDPRCNDGDNQGDGWLTGDINFLDATLPYDCPPNGSEDQGGTKCCNYSSSHLCSIEDYDICCRGNKNSDGGRSTMSYADAPGPRGFDNRELEYLSSIPGLNCSENRFANQQTTLLIPGEVIGFVLNISLNISSDDLVEEETIIVSRGRPTATSILDGLSGDYTLQILDASQNELLTQSFSLYFDYNGPVFEDVDYSGITYSSQDVSFRFPFSNAMETLNLYHNDELIYTKDLPKLSLIYLPLIDR